MPNINNKNKKNSKIEGTIIILFTYKTWFNLNKSSLTCAFSKRILFLVILTMLDSNFYWIKKNVALK